VFGDRVVEGQEEPVVGLPHRAQGAARFDGEGWVALALMARFVVSGGDDAPVGNQLLGRILANLIPTAIDQ
jgi:hypothetical protein